MVLVEVCHHPLEWVPHPLKWMRVAEWWRHPLSSVSEYSRRQGGGFGAERLWWVGWEPLAVVVGQR